MKKTVSLVLALLMLLSIVGCGGKTVEGSKSSWVTYKEAYGSVKSDSGTDVLVYSYQQPVLNSKASGANIINTKLNDATTAFLYGSGGVQELTDLAKMDYKETWFTCYSLTRDVSVARMDDAVISFRYSDYSFSGGMHGYTAEYGVTYDMVSGVQLRLEDLTDDAPILREACRQYILEQVEDEASEWKDGLLPNYTAYLDSVLNNWVFTEDGLQFIAQPYVIAAYAVGTLRFTVPYAYIEDVLKDKFLPEKRGHGGGTMEMSVVSDSEPAPTNFHIDTDGMMLLVRVNGTIYDFSVEGVGVYPGDGTMVYYLTQQSLYSPKISSESFGLQVNVPDGRPATMIRWRDGEGKESRYLLVYDGKDGRVLMQTVNNPLTRD